MDEQKHEPYQLVGVLMTDKGAVKFSYSPTERDPWAVSFRGAGRYFRNADQAAGYSCGREFIPAYRVEELANSLEKLQAGILIME